MQRDHLQASEAEKEQLLDKIEALETELVSAGIEAGEVEASAAKLSREDRLARRDSARWVRCLEMPREIVLRMATFRPRASHTPNKKA